MDTHKSRDFRTKNVPLAVILAFASMTPAALAKPKEKTYPASCDRVWLAVKRATAPPHYNFAQFNDAEKKGIVSTGMALTGKRYLDITVSGTGNACTVALGGSFSGLTHNDKGDLFERIKEQLVEVPELPETTASAKGSPTEIAKPIGKPLTNADVVKLNAAGLTEQLIIDKIRVSPADYRLDTNDLVELKHAGLSDAVIRAMIQASQH